MWFGDPITMLGALLQNREPQKSITGLLECKIWKEDEYSNCGMFDEIHMYKQMKLILKHL